MVKSPSSDPHSCDPITGQNSEPYFASVQFRVVQLVYKIRQPNGCPPKKI